MAADRVGAGVAAAARLPNLAGDFIRVVFRQCADGRLVLVSGFIGIGTVLAALAGAWLINHWSHGRKTFETPVGVAKFAFVCFTPTAIVSSAFAIGGFSSGQ